ncbi:hypothetical protein U14_02258 [Candidatus Moduliflexus flocculans]|uniref:Ice-binding protein C-terminal domain-containing protein n=1 Tax=Candidatus Moduliflexus flocculans TaxID=1499966 RepID=A0A0S6VTY2_9BACT|nr:hypothetical protein U14_02258 [Candidatus Moduliflexus flocculans]
MRKFLVTFCAVAMMFVSANRANACTEGDPACPTGSTRTTWTDTINTFYKFDYRGESYTYIHDITDSGFVPSEDKSLSISLDLTFADDNDREWESVNVFTLGFDKIFNLSMNLTPTISLDGSVIFDATGKLTVKLTQTVGDFYFKKSVMTVTGCDVPTVPEPATLLLLGGGLLGLIGYGRKKMNK